MDELSARQLAEKEKAMREHEADLAKEAAYQQRIKDALKFYWFIFIKTKIYIFDILFNIIKHIFIIPVTVFVRRLTLMDFAANRSLVPAENHFGALKSVNLSKRESRID